MVPPPCRRECERDEWRVGECECARRLRWELVGAETCEMESRGVTRSLWSAGTAIVADRSGERTFDLPLLLWPCGGGEGVCVGEREDEAERDFGLGL